MDSSSKRGALAFAELLGEDWEEPVKREVLGWRRTDEEESVRLAGSHTAGEQRFTGDVAPCDRPLTDITASVYYDNI